MSAAISGRHLRADNVSMARPMRNGPPVMTQPIDLGSPPAVYGLSGFGIGSGAFIRNQGRDADQAQGLVVVKVGINPGVSGVLQISFPAGAVTGQYVLQAEWATFALTTTTNVLQGNWTGTRPLVAGETLLAAYQWTTSV